MGSIDQQGALAPIDSRERTPETWPCPDVGIERREDGDCELSLVARSQFLLTLSLTAAPRGERARGSAAFGLQTSFA